MLRLRSRLLRVIARPCRPCTPFPCASVCAHSPASSRVVGAVSAAAARSIHARAAGCWSDAAAVSAAHTSAAASQQSVKPVDESDEAQTQQQQQLAHDQTTGLAAAPASAHGADAAPAPSSATEAAADADPPPNAADPQLASSDGAEADAASAVPLDDDDGDWGPPLSAATNACPSFSSLHPTPPADRMTRHLASALTQLTNVREFLDRTNAIQTESEVDRLKKATAAAAAAAAERHGRRGARRPSRARDQLAEDDDEYGEDNSLVWNALMLQIRSRAEPSLANLLHRLRADMAAGANQLHDSATSSYRYDGSSAEDPLIRSYTLASIVELVRRLRLWRWSSWLWREYARHMVERSERSMDRLVDAWEGHMRAQRQKRPSSGNGSIFSRDRSAPLPPQFAKPPPFFPLLYPRALLVLLRSLARSHDLPSAVEVHQMWLRTAAKLDQVESRLRRIELRYGRGAATSGEKVKWSALPPFFREIPAFQPVVELYAAMLHCCAHALPGPDVVRARALVSEWNALSPRWRRGECDSDAEAVQYLRSCLLGVYARAGHHHGAMTLLRHIEQPDAAEVTMALSACHRAVLSTRSNSKAQGEGEDGDPLTPQGSQAVRAGLALVESIRRQQGGPQRWALFWPDSRFYSRVVQLYSAAGDVQACVHFYEELARQVEVELSLSRRKHGGAAPPVVLKVDFFEALIQCCHSAVVLVRRLGSRRGRVAAAAAAAAAKDATSSALAAALPAAVSDIGSDSGETEELHAVLELDEWEVAAEEAEQEDSATLGLALALFGERAVPLSALAYPVPRLVEIATGFLAAMQAPPFNLRPSAAVYQSMLEVYAAAGARNLSALATRDGAGAGADAAGSDAAVPFPEALWSDMRSKHIAATPALHVAMLRALEASAGVEGVLRWHGEMVSMRGDAPLVSPASVRVVLQSVAHAVERRMRAQEQAAAQARMASADGSPSGPDTEALARSSHEATTFAQAMHDAAVGALHSLPDAQIDRSCLLALVRVLVSSRRLDLALKCVGSMVGAAALLPEGYRPRKSAAFPRPNLQAILARALPTLPIYTALLDACAQARNYDAGARVWDLVRARGAAESGAASASASASSGPEGARPADSSVLLPSMERAAHVQWLLLLIRCERPLAEVEEAYRAIRSFIGSDTALQLGAREFELWLRAARSTPSSSPTRGPLILFLYRALHSDARVHVAEVAPSVHHFVWLAVRALPDLSPRDPIFLQVDYAVERSITARHEEREKQRRSAE